MKKFIVFLLLLPALCFGQGAHRVSQVIIKGNGISANVGPGSKILVCVVNTGCATSANIYLDSALTTPAPNPLTADSSGNYNYYISSGCVDEQISAPGQGSQFIPRVCPFNGQSGGSTPPAAPQYAVQYAGPGATTFNADSTFTFNTSTHGLSAYLTNGAYNTDVARTGGTSNNGLANLLAGPCALGGCTPIFPGNSTSTELSMPTVSNTHVTDYRNGSQGDYFYNPDPSGGGGYSPNGARYSGGKSIYFTGDKSFLTNGAQNQTALQFFNNFNSPGWSYGTVPTGIPTSYWSQQHAINIIQSISTPGIGQMIFGQQDKYAIGDGAGMYINPLCDGGFTGGGDEGCTGIGMDAGQHTTWFHGTVNAGATTGTQLLQTTYTAGTNSRPQYSVGGVMMDISHLTVNGAHVTGVATAISGYSVWETPTDATVAISAAWGRANAAIPALTNPTVPQSDTVAFTVDGGTNAGGYTVGTACLAGADHYEQVAITAVGTLSGGVQSVTLTHRYPDNQNGTSLWQGGLCGNYYSAAAAYFYLNNWRTDYPVVGSRDGSKIVGRFYSPTSVDSVGLPIPTLYNASTTNVPIVNLSISGTTVTATYGGARGPSAFSNINQAAINCPSNSTYNGTVSNVSIINTYQLTWTQSGPTGTCSSATISYAPIYYQFWLIPGAAVTQPCTSAGCPLEPNSVPWSAGNNVENAFDPSYRGDNISSAQVVMNPDDNTHGITTNLTLSSQGPGISGAYNFLDIENQNSASLYKGGGGAGFLSPPVAAYIGGPTSTDFYINSPPLDNLPVFEVGCPPTGCNGSNTLSLLWMNLGQGQMNYTPASTGGTFVFTNTQTNRSRSAIMSTGLGLLNDNPVAISSSNSVVGDDVMGTYAAVGNETPLDTSGTLAAKSYYAGLVHAGALAPTINGVRVIGTGGSTTWTYSAKCVTQTGESLPGTASTSVGNATLSSGNYNALNITPGYGCQSVNVYRTSGTTGLICQNVPNNLANGTGTSDGCDDKGQATLGPLTADVDTSGNITSAAGTFATSLTVAGQNVCQANGTHCLAAATLPVGSLTTTAATSDNLTVTGMTSSGHCSLTATNATAATNIATTYISAKTSNQITVTHTATSGMTYDAICTPY